MLSTLLSRTAVAALPAAGPLVSVLVPVLAYLMTQRKLDIRISIG